MLNGRRQQLFSQIEWWTYITTLLLAIVWLALHWPHNSLWYDETVTAYIIGQPLKDLWRWSTAIDFQLPLYLGVMKVWNALFSPASVLAGEFALRASSFFCAILALGAMLALGRRLAGKVGASIVVASLALLPAFVYIAFEVRAYGVTFAAFTWSCVFLWDLFAHYGKAPVALNRNYAKVLSFYVLTLMAALYSHYTTLFVFPAHIAFILTIVFTNLIRGRNWRRPLWIGVHALALIAVAYVPWLPTMLRSSTSANLYFGGGLTPDQSWRILLNFTVSAQDSALSANQWLLYGLLGAMALSTVAWLVRRKQWYAFWFTVLVVILPPAILIVIVLYRAKLTGRYAWGMWIGVVLLIALGSTVIQTRRTSGLRRGLQWSAVIGVIAGILVMPWISHTVALQHNSDFRGAFTYLREHWQSSDLVILRDGTIFTAAEYYGSPKPYLGLPAIAVTDVTRILHRDEVISVLRQQDNSIHGVWIVSWQGDISDPENVTVGLLESIGTLQRIDRSFGDVDLQYIRLNQSLPDISSPIPDMDPVRIPSEDLTLNSFELITRGVVSAGDPILIHSWWKRTGMVHDDTRISVRLYSPDGRVVGIQDQPPAGWVYFPSRWPLNTPILGRYVMLTPDNPPSTLAVKLVIYSGAQKFAPIEIAVGSVNCAATKTLQAGIHVTLR